MAFDLFCLPAGVTEMVSHKTIIVTYNLCFVFKLCHFILYTGNILVIFSSCYLVFNLCSVLEDLGNLSLHHTTGWAVRD